jgi:hypothetical protein
VLPIQVALIVQRSRKLDHEQDRVRLAETTRRLRPPLRRQLASLLIRLGTRLAGCHPIESPGGASASRL